MQYFSHPIIEALLKNPESNKKQLFANSGITNKREFLAEIKMLDEENHLQCNFDVYYPRFNKLVSFSKPDDKFTASSILDYVSYKDLRSLLDGKEYLDEFEIEFLTGHLKVSSEHESFFQKLTLEKLDFDNYDYYVRSEIDWSNHLKEKKYLLKEWIVVHLDDHSLYGKGVEKEMKKYFPNCKWFYFAYANDALGFIEDRVKEEEPIHLIITDIQHVGLNGYEFATVVRDLEEDYHRFHTSILALTMQPKDHPLVQRGLEEKVFTEYRNKITDAEEIAGVAKYLFEPDYLNQGKLYVDPWMR